MVVTTWDDVADAAKAQFAGIDRHEMQLFNTLSIPSNCYFWKGSSLSNEKSEIRPGKKAFKLLLKILYQSSV